MERLPIEMISSIAEHLDESDVCNFRSVNRQLREGSYPRFTRLFFDEVEVDVSLRTIDRLASLFALPPRAYCAIERIVVSAHHVPEICELGELQLHSPFNVGDSEIRCLARCQQHPLYGKALEEQTWLLNSGRFALDLGEVFDNLPNLMYVEITDFVAERPTVMGRLIPSLGVRDDSPADPSDDLADILHNISEGSHSEDGVCQRLDHLWVKGSAQFVNRLIATVLAAMSRCRGSIYDFTLHITRCAGLSDEHLPPTLHSTDACTDVTSVDISLKCCDLTPTTLDAFMRRFGDLESLTLNSAGPQLGFSSILSSISPDSLLNIHLGFTECCLEDWQHLIQGDRWKNLQTLSLVRINLYEELQAWVQIFQWLDTRPNLESLFIKDCMVYSQNFIGIHPRGATELCNHVNEGIPCISNILIHEKSGSWALGFQKVSGRYGSLSEFANELRVVEMVEWDSESPSDEDGDEDGS